MGRERRGRSGPGREAPSSSGTVEEVDQGRAELRADPGRPGARTLLIDGAPQSHVDLDDPGHLDFVYQRRIGHLVDLMAPERAPLKVLHLGGGAFTLARYVAATRPRSTQQIAENDGRLVQFVRRELPLDPGARIRVRTGDAREILGKLSDGWADLVISDVFAGARTPAHLTSREFYAETVRVLAPGGVLAANLADGPPLTHLRRQIATAGSLFAESALVADPPVLRGKRFGNAVLCCSAAGLPVAALARRAAADPQSGRLLSGRELADFTGGAAPVTDAAATDSPAPPPGTFD